MQRWKHALFHEIKQHIKYWTFPVLRPRRFHAYGVGMPKSGTNSMDGILGRYRAMHEPEEYRYMSIIMAAAEGSLSGREFRAKVRTLDRKLWLEFNSSWLNYYLLDVLLDEYPQAKFILTIRDCYSWLDSIINQLLSRKHEPFQERFHAWVGSRMPVGPHAKEEQALADLGLYPLERWFAGWARHNSVVLSKVPADRLLVVRTKDIGRDLGRIAHFLGVPAESLDGSRSHLFKAEGKYGILARIDPAFLKEKADRYCGELMQRFFPEIRDLTDIEEYRSRDQAYDTVPERHRPLAAIQPAG